MQFSMFLAQRDSVKIHFVLVLSWNLIDNVEWCREKSAKNAINFCHGWWTGTSSAMHIHTYYHEKSVFNHKKNVCQFHTKKLYFVNFKTLFQMKLHEASDGTDGYACVNIKYTPLLAPVGTFCTAFISKGGIASCIKLSWVCSQICNSW